MKPSKEIDSINGDVILRIDNIRHIAVVDDDEEIANLLSIYLRQNKYLTSLCRSTEELDKLLKHYTFDVIVMDIMMPNMRGDEYLKMNRNKINIPVILLSALGDVDDRINGLEVGASDYLTKPFDPKELLLRIQNLMARKGIVADVTRAKVDNIEKKLQEVRFDQWRFIIDSSRLMYGDIELHITSVERSLMGIFCRNIGVPLERNKLANMLGGDMNARTIDTQIARLRAKIEINSKQPKNLKTVRNTGYIFYGTEIFE